jgi:hypothetical protein
MVLLLRYSNEKIYGKSRQQHGFRTGKRFGYHLENFLLPNEINPTFMLALQFITSILDSVRVRALALIYLRLSVTTQPTP